MDAENDKQFPELSSREKNNTETEENNNEKFSGDIGDNKESPSTESNPEPDRIREAKIVRCPTLPPDLRKVCEQVDQYISSLLEAKTDGKSTPPPDLPISIEKFIVLVEEKIGEYDSGDSLPKWSRLTQKESSNFLEIVNRVSSLSKALCEISSEYKYATAISRVGGVLQRAMSNLEEELKSLLEDYKIPDSDCKKPNQSQSDENTTAWGYSDEVLSNLIKLAQTMIDGGYESECSQVYIAARRNALEEIISKSGLETHTIDDVQKMHWELLEREIDFWIRAFNQAAKVHIPNECKLCDTVFPDNRPSFSKGLCGSLCYGVIAQFLNFPGAVTLTKRSTEKLFKYIDVYEALRDNLPLMENLFPEGCLVDLKTEAASIRGHLGETIVAIFGELENSIKGDQSVKNQVPGGAVHPLTIYTMNYIVLACEYTKTLEQVFNEVEVQSDSANASEHDRTPDDPESDQSPFQACIVKIMDLLDLNIEAKSRQYKDPSLSSIFMMNNGRYILKKIRGSNELNSLLGDNWYRKKSSSLRQYHKGYQRETWGKLLSCFQPDGLTANGKVMKPVLKERFKSFNSMFDEIHKTQSHWVVGDGQLQSELRVSISNMVVPAYRSFLARYSQTFTPGRQTEKYVKFQPEDIEAHIDELFDGNAGPSGKKKLYKD